MAYKGEHLYQCGRVPFDWRNAGRVIVSGTFPNPCGHAVACAGSYYFHVDGARTHPWVLSSAGYQRYLKENDKTKLGWS